ncbi:MAG TPA: polysaccharide biosynthesis protein, partial [bacterium (Candidatus Stahlbacteria)]|nr:polysaccharide biosynthesis protein [Candidatus Stahlbacteria bacterium]
ISRVFTRFSPNVVFHAAAYKHVPMLEEHPDEAVKNNIIGTRVMAEIARDTGVDKFILISTDKAVNPTSVMGVTKRVAEMTIQTFNGKSATKFIAVRFGNVLESRGSVIPIFKEQIKRGGPVTITHPEMKRYFMTLPEAALLILQAGAIGTGGEVFVLDMGDPIKIVDLAEEMIRLSGLEPDKDIPIVFTGIRPGEKLFEEILTAEEGTQATKYRKIFTAKMNLRIKEEELLQYVDKLERLADVGDNDEILKILKILVPTYEPNKVIAT